MGNGWEMGAVARMFYKLGFIARRRAEQGDSAGAQGRAQGPPKAEPGLPGGGEAITRRAAAAA